MGERYTPDSNLSWERLIDVRPNFQMGQEGLELEELLASEAKHLARVIEYVGLTDDAETLLFKKNSLITPKTVEMLQVSAAGSELGFETGGKIQLSGEAHPVFEDDLWGSRAVHYPQTYSYNGYDYYLDIKGLGKNGKRLYTWHHDEGDPMFGTYLDGATREFEIPQTMIELGATDIQIPVFLAEIPQEEYIKHATVGLYETLSARLGFVFSHKETIEAGLQNYPSAINPFENRYDWHIDASASLAASLAIEMYSSYQDGGIEAVKAWANKYHTEEEVSVLLSDKQFGVSARLIRSYERIGAMLDKDIGSEENRAVARTVGGFCRSLLEQGFWAISPSPANWTVAGEFIDFEDVIRWPQDKDLVIADMAFRDIVDSHSYIAYTFGRGCLGSLRKDFQTGFMGRETSEEELIETAVGVLGL